METIMNLDKNAPVSHRDSIKISAPIGRVWRLMADIENWPKWNKDIKSSHLNGELKPSTTFTWKAGPGTITSKLEAVEPNKLIAWSGKTMGIRAVHIWRLKSEGKFTIVTTEESWSGIPAQIFNGYSKRTLEKAIKSGLQLLKVAAEERISS